ncbi:hypothetical protein [Schleiferilactobacillus shenzhenensis]|nr:hypothetical protein [Schleiferilactobacillus shenzhenensis]
MLHFWRIKGLWIRSGILIVLIGWLAYLFPDFTTDMPQPQRLELFASFFNPSQSLFATLLLFISSSVLITDYWVTGLAVHWTDFVVGRRSRAWLLRHLFFTTFIFSFGLMLVLQLVVYGVMTYVRGPITLTGDFESQYLMFANLRASLLAGVLTHCIGYAVFSDFVLMIGLWIKKPFIFRISGPLIALVMFIGLAMLNTIPVLKNFLAYLYLPNLIAPGQVGDFGTFMLPLPSWLVFVIAVGLYSLVTVLGTVVRFKRGGEVDG